MNARARDSSDLAAMRAEISKITGRSCVSTNRRYLQIRLAALKRTALDPEPARPHAGDAAPVSVSLGGMRRDLLGRLCARASMSTSALIRRAFDEYAVKQGFFVEIQRITQKEGS